MQVTVAALLVKNRSAISGESTAKIPLALRLAHSYFPSETFSHSHSWILFLDRENNDDQDVQDIFYMPQSFSKQLSFQLALTP